MPFRENGDFCMETEQKQNHWDVIVIGAGMAANHLDISRLFIQI